MVCDALPLETIALSDQSSVQCRKSRQLSQKSKHHPNPDHQQHTLCNATVRFCAASIVRPLRVPTLHFPISRFEAVCDLTILSIGVQSTADSRAIRLCRVDVHSLRKAARRARHREFRPMVQSRADVRSLKAICDKLWFVMAFYRDCPGGHNRSKLLNSRRCRRRRLGRLSISRGDAVEADVGRLKDVDGDGRYVWQGE